MEVIPNEDMDAENPKKNLRRGFTTGACAAAAALGAARMLSEGKRIEKAEILLPAGFAARFELQGQEILEQSARCFVVKDAGDDPDITHGVEVHAEAAWMDASVDGAGEGQDEIPVTIKGGAGIGRVTKRGLAVPVGEWAINPVPRRMIEEAVRSVLPSPLPEKGLRVTISIPDGKQRAARTLNERLGVVGGLSILGTTGVVQPISHKAWTDTLEVAIDVALAAGLDTIILATGRTSERAARRFIALQEEAFVLMGDFVGHALETCRKKGVPRIVLAAQFAKLVKIACGHDRTHVRFSRLDLGILAEWMRKAGLDEVTSGKIECANTAREVFEDLKAGIDPSKPVAQRAIEQMRRRAPESEIAVLLVDYQGGTTIFRDQSMSPGGKGEP